MTRLSSAFFLPAFIIGLVISATPPAPAQSHATTPSNRSGTEIINELRGFRMPRFDRDRDQTETGYRAEYLAGRNSALKKKADLIAELFRTAPAHEEVAQFLAQRWFILTGPLRQAAEALLEIERTLKRKQLNPAVAREAWYARAHAYIALTRQDNASAPALSDAGAAISAFVETFPRDERSVELLKILAKQLTASPARKQAIYEQMILDYPDNPSAKYWPGKIRQLTSIGQPFTLNFTDAVTAETISVAELRGQVIVINFWATSSRPASTELARQQKLAASYRTADVKFIGISLDQPASQGGRQRLQSFCNENAINWPQFYQGNGWNSKFSVAWGIDSIPTTFLLDREGKLVSTDAGPKLAEWLPLLLGETATANAEP